MKRIGMVLVAIVLLTQSLAAANDVSPPSNENSPVGGNLAVLQEWSSEYAFIDAFKQSGEWLTQTQGVWNTGEIERVPVDDSGWPRSLSARDAAPVNFKWISTLMFDNLNGQYPGGEYLVLYDGDGTLAYDLDAELISSEPGRDVINVTPSNRGILLQILETDPQNTDNYIRNIRVLSPGFDAAEAELFHPHFLRNIENLKVLRFMDWMRTNVSPYAVRSEPQQMHERPHPLDDAEVSPYLRSQNGDQSADSPLEWKARPRADDARYTTDAGVPLQIMLALANELHADPWFNMPHNATDGYMSAFAQEVREGLHREGYVYVEFSNEVWNSSFYQAHYAEQRGMELWPQTIDEHGKQLKPLHKRLSWYGKRVAEMCDIWKTEFAGQEERVICVMAGQAANSWIVEQMLNCPLWQEGPCFEHGIDAIAIAPYFGQHIGRAQYESQVEGWTSDLADGGLSRLFTELVYGTELTLPANQQVKLSDAVEDIEAHAELAERFNVKLVAYEGGQHLVGVGSPINNARITELFNNANRDPRMGNLYEQYFNAWHNAGGEIFVHYNTVGIYGKWGSWGAREYADSLSTAKQKAIDNYIESNDCDWEQCYPSDTVAVAIRQIEDSTAQNILPLVALIAAAATLLALRRRRAR